MVRSSLILIDPNHNSEFNRHGYLIIWFVRGRNNRCIREKSITQSRNIDTRIKSIIDSIERSMKFRNDYPLNVKYELDRTMHLGVVHLVMNVDLCQKVKYLERIQLYNNKISLKINWHHPID